MVDNPFDAPFVAPWRYVFARYIDRKRKDVTSWNELCRELEKDTKTVKEIRDEFGIDQSVGPDAQPSAQFRVPDSFFLGLDI